MNKDWRPEGWDKAKLSCIPKGSFEVETAVYVALEAGAGAIIPYVEAETLKRVGEWLWLRYSEALRFGNATYILHIEDVERLRRGEMPGEEGGE